MLRSTARMGVACCRQLRRVFIGCGCLSVSTFEARTGRLCFLQLQQCFCSYKFGIHVGMQAFYNAVAKHQSIPLRRMKSRSYLAQQMHLQPHQLLVWVAGGRLLQRVPAKIKFFGSAFLWASGTCRNGSFVRSFNPT